MPDLEKAVKKRNFDDKRSAHSARHTKKRKVQTNDRLDGCRQSQAPGGLVEETVALLPQDGGHGSHAAASHVFTADPGGVRRPQQPPLTNIATEF